ncbi:dTDP-L-rhamnose 4-epimerase [Hasllibacter halocynthiae]|uniref:dTDP-L-rhamnose 4-epimerase n=1 Tax=Hasllibacter halocynthiae TaxID=595589 RepID=A0A2T0X967_9RHOB|nr:NAD-dependent epimerase/dehydratase family protein [Hasllibacter halocynthiae]PRY95469.1 dTDP-L-rhamnose 4-epimerase [Hasllibacter halocynthiae]
MHLITGGAGFIGRKLARQLLDAGERVRILDPLIAQVHGAEGRPPPEVEGAEIVRGDIRDLDAVRGALEGVEGVFHLAAEVGVGQSMYEIDRYTAVNELGTAVLFQAITDAPEAGRPRRVVTASSMSVYGEGLYVGPGGRPLPPARRGGGWDPVGPEGEALTPVPTPEGKPCDLASVYALNKFAQERMTHIVAGAYGIESVALRLFNVYGPGQALSNPYTGVLAIFASRIANGQRPMVFEDGRQRRDFVHVDDVARAFRLAMERPEAAGATINVGSGRSVSVAEVAEATAAALGRPDLAPQITGKARTGDIRHCFADIALARGALGFEPRRTFAEALPEMAEWVAGQRPEDRVERASEELRARGLVA